MLTSSQRLADVLVKATIALIILLLLSAPSALAGEADYSDVELLPARYYIYTPPATSVKPSKPKFSVDHPRWYKFWVIADKLACYAAEVCMYIRR